MSSIVALRAMVSRNLPLKLSALGIAILLWFSVRFEARNQQEISNVTVRVDLSDPGWVLAEDSGEEGVSVRFGGPALELLRLSSDRPVVVIPVTDVGSADTTLVIQPGWVRFGERPGVRVESVAPATLALRFEPVQRITLAPSLTLAGELPDELALMAAPSPSVREFRVSGPRSRVDALDSIPLRPLDLSRVTGSGTVTLEVDTARLTGVQVQPRSLEVSVQVEARVEREIRLPAPPLPDRPELEGLTGYPSAIPVMLDGPESGVQAIDPGSLLLTLELPVPLDPEADRVEVRFRLQGLPPFVQGRVEPVELRREEP